MFGIGWRVKNRVSCFEEAESLFERKRVPIWPKPKRQIFGNAPAMALTFL